MYKKIAGYLRYSSKLGKKSSEKFRIRLETFFESSFCLNMIVWLKLTKAMQVRVTLIDIRRST